METKKLFSKDIILLLMASFFYMASPMLVTPLITGFSESLGAGSLVMGIVGGLTNICSLCIQPFAGGIADKVSKYKLGCIGVTFLILACLGYVIAQNPAIILLFRALNGIGFAFCSVCFSTWIANILPPDKIGFGMGLYGMMNALAMAVSPAIGVTIYHKFGYRIAFVFALGFAIACILSIQFCTDKGNPILKQQPDKKKRLRLFEPKIIPLALVIMCFTIPYCATQSFIVRYAESKNLPITVSLYFTIYAIALLVSRFILSNAFDRVNFKIFLFIGSACALLSMYFMTTMHNNLQMALAAVFMAGGYGLMCTVAQSEAVTSVKEEKRGLANSTYYIGLNLGMALGPFLGGILYGSISIDYFYPVFMSMVPLSLILYFGSKFIYIRYFDKKK